MPDGLHFLEKRLNPLPIGRVPRQRVCVKSAADLTAENRLRSYMNRRGLKQQIGRLLAAGDFKPALAAIRRCPPRRAISPLFGFFCDLDETVKWHAVTAAGTLVADLADTDLESARTVVRRFIWNLNDESGGIGWGCPEAMGESLARSGALASEYWCILTSYIQPGGNYLEHTMLQRGAVWGVGRLARSRPQLIASCGKLLLPYLKSNDTILRATALWAAEALPALELQSALPALTEDHSKVSLYDGLEFKNASISALAHRAIDAFSRNRR